MSYDIGLIDVDSHNFPNLPLMKLSAWHKGHGDTVEWYLDRSKRYDVVYQSKVFDDTYSKDIGFMPNAEFIIRGGTGYGLNNRLPKQIEHIMPDYHLYGITDTAYGFLTRGCPRGCGFCIVGKKEGLKSVKVADLQEFWDDQPNIKLLDPNLLACPDHMELLDQLIASRAIVDITQGLDIRLMTDDIAEKLGLIRAKRVYFAWDNPNQDLRPSFARFAKVYRRKSAASKVVFVLTNYDSSLEQDLYRIYTLRELGYDPYVMVYDKPNAPEKTRKLQRWVNNKFIFRRCMTFEEYQGGQKC